jgi:hypothetical protein
MNALVGFADMAFGVIRLRMKKFIALFGKDLLAWKVPAKGIMQASPYK